jgi:hypothetical protein
MKSIAQLKLRHGFFQSHVPILNNGGSTYARLIYAPHHLHRVRPATDLVPSPVHAIFHRITICRRSREQSSECSSMNVVWLCCANMLVRAGGHHGLELSIETSRKRFHLLFWYDCWIRRFGLPLLPTPPWPSVSECRNPSCTGSR